MLNSTQVLPLKVINPKEKDNWPVQAVDIFHGMCLLYLQWNLKMGHMANVNVNIGPRSNLSGAPLKTLW